MNNDYLKKDNKELYGSYEGFIKGNIFKNLYDKYRDYEPIKLIPNNEKSELILNIDQLCLMINDIRLYLDIYEDDYIMINKFNEYSEKLKDYINIYESKYGPLLSTSLENNRYFSWQVDTWPWEMEEI